MRKLNAIMPQQNTVWSIPKTDTSASPFSRLLSSVFHAPTTISALGRTFSRRQRILRLSHSSYPTLPAIGLTVPSLPCLALMSSCSPFRSFLRAVALAGNTQPPPPTAGCLYAHFQCAWKATYHVPTLALYLLHCSTTPPSPPLKLPPKSIFTFSRKM